MSRGERQKRRGVLDDGPFIDALAAHRGGIADVDEQHERHVLFLLVAADLQFLALRRLLPVDLAQVLIRIGDDFCARFSTRSHETGAEPARADARGETRRGDVEALRAGDDFVGRTARFPGFPPGRSRGGRTLRPEQSADDEDSGEDGGRGEENKAGGREGEFSDAADRGEDSQTGEGVHRPSVGRAGVVFDQRVDFGDRLPQYFRFVRVHRTRPLRVVVRNLLRGQLFLEEVAELYQVLFRVALVVGAFRVERSAAGQRGSESLGAQFLQEGLCRPLHVALVKSGGDLGGGLFSGGVSGFESGLDAERSQRRRKFSCGRLRRFLGVVERALLCGRSLDLGGELVDVVKLERVQVLPRRLAQAGLHHRVAGGEGLLGLFDQVLEAFLDRRPGEGAQGLAVGARFGLNGRLQRIPDFEFFCDAPFARRGEHESEELRRVLVGGDFGAELAAERADQFGRGLGL